MYILRYPIWHFQVIKFGDRVIKAGASFGRPPPSKPMTFKEKMRQQLIKTIEEGGDVSQAFTDKGMSLFVKIEVITWMTWLRGMI